MCFSNRTWRRSLCHIFLRLKASFSFIIFTRDEGLRWPPTPLPPPLLHLPQLWLLSIPCQYCLAAVVHIILAASLPTSSFWGFAALVRIYTEEKARNSVRWKEEILQLQKSLPSPDSCTDRSTFAPRPPRNPMLGCVRFYPPLNGKNIATQHWTSGGRGGKRDCVPCMCCFMGGLVSNRPMMQYLFHPPTGQQELRSFCSSAHRA